MHPQTQSGLSADRNGPGTLPPEAAMRVQDAVTEDGPTIPPSCSARDAWELIRTGRRTEGAARRTTSGETQVPPLIRRADGCYREGIPAFLRRATLVNLLSTPVVYSIGVPLLLLDAWTTLYQRVCFPLYGIAPVRRQEHFVMDRHRLPYLNPIEKLHCIYCSYATGLLSYVREIAARTEQYWCPIKHATPVAAPHEHYQLFVDYGDGAAYRDGLPALRQRLWDSPAASRHQEDSHDRDHHEDSRTGGLQPAR
jgi:hypothetical protein